MKETLCKRIHPLPQLRVRDLDESVTIMLFEESRARTFVDHNVRGASASGLTRSRSTCWSFVGLMGNYAIVAS